MLSYNSEKLANKNVNNTALIYILYVPFYIHLVLLPTSRQKCDGQKKVEDVELWICASLSFVSSPLGRGGQTQFHRGPHQHYGCTQRAGRNFQSQSLFIYIAHLKQPQLTKVLHREQI